MEVFGGSRLPEAAEAVRARLVALFQPAFPADGTATERQGEPPTPPGDAAPEHLHADPPARRWSLTSRHVVVMAALCLVAVVGSVGWMLRARAVPIAVAVPADSTVAASPTAGGPSGSTPSTVPTTARSPTILVHVLGAVVAPGVVALEQGARVADALKAAGGLRPDADPADLNLAAVLADGSQIVIGTTTAPKGEVRTGSLGAGGVVVSSAGAAVIDLNTATLDQLDSLPGVGPVLAQAILDYRTKHGRFTRVEELQEVDGIGSKTYAQIAPHVRV